MSRRFSRTGSVLLIVFLLTLAFYEKKSHGNLLETMQTGALEKPKIALTFDDGPHKTYTKEMLDGLRKRNVKATFFLQGQCIEGNEELVQTMQEDGHLIGNHTFHHVELKKLSDSKAQEEVVTTCNEIYKVTGNYPVFVRPPFGSWKKGLDFHVTMIPVLWNVDSRDWLLQDTPQIVSRVLKTVKDGDIILMHDCYATSVEAAMQIIDRLQEQGYEFVTVEELILA